jgi:membrane protein required for colicin V production
MNTLDIIVVAIVALSGLFAFVRGFVREALSIAAWAGAGLVTYYGYAPFQPIVRGLVKALWLADILTGAVLFLVSVVVFSIIVGILSSQVRGSVLGPLDRALGLLFGVARGVLLVCLGYLAISHFLAPENWPGWILEARSRPLLATGAAELQQLIPRNLPNALPGAAEGIRRTETAVKAGAAIKNASETLDQLNQPPKVKTVPKLASPGNPEANSDTKGLDQLIQAQGAK